MPAPVARSNDGPKHSCGQSMFSTNCVSLLFMLSVQITFLNGMDSGFTFLLAARKRECFFETLKVNMSLDLEYQVNLNILLTL